MPHIVARLLMVSMLAVSFAAWAKDTSPTDGVSAAADIVIPRHPLSSRDQLDAYLRDTPPAKSPLNWLTPGGQRRFLASLIFSQHGVGGLGTDDLRYDLTREQAYAVLQLFGAQSSAVNLDARTTPRTASANAIEITLERSYDNLMTVADTGDDPALMRSYAAGFAPHQTDAQRHALGDADMQFLFRATARTVGIAATPSQLAMLRADFAELERRQAVDRPQVGDFYDALLRARQVEEARALLASHPLLDRNPPPRMRLGSRIRNGQPSLWVASANRRELTRFRFNFHMPSQVVVLGSTGCHFSVNAARALEADPLLRDIFRDYAQWVAPSADLTAFDAIRTWNRTYPDMRLGISHDEHELPMIKRFDTPTFYFLDHGSVVVTVVGWPDGGNLEAIRRGLREINLLR